MTAVLKAQLAYWKRQHEARDRQDRHAVKWKKFMNVERRAVGLLPEEEE